jgi:REP element-mobilizing transposase RayT
MDRFWLITWTTYGTWLPGDERGFVSQVNDGRGEKVTHNIYGTRYDSGWQHLRKKMQQSLKCNPIRLNREQAKIIVDQIQETCRFRSWQLVAGAVMANHCHVVLGVSGDPDPATLLRDLKSYASRALNKQWVRPASGTWWTESGSTRVLKKEDAILSAVAYVRDQEFPLACWIDPRFASELGSGIAPGKLF